MRQRKEKRRGFKKNRMVYEEKGKNWLQKYDFKNKYNAGIKLNWWDAE